MEWRDEGLVIGVRRHGETSSIVETMTRAHGRHLGLVRGGRSARLNAALQPGNTLGLVWRARLDEHLGAFAIEPMRLRAGRLMESGLALAGIAWLGALARLLPERDPHEAVYETLTLIAERLDDSTLAPPLVARFEALILAECGFRLDLEPMRGDRRQRRPGLRLAEVGQGGQRRSRRALARPPAAPAGFPARGRASRSATQPGRDRRRLSPDGLLSGARPVRAARRAAARTRAGRSWRRRLRRAAAEDIWTFFDFSELSQTVREIPRFCDPDLARFPLDFLSDS